MRNHLLAAVLSAVVATTAGAAPTNQSVAPAAPKAASAPAGPDAPIRATIAKVNPNAVIASIKPTPIAGLKEVIADGSVVYISDNGRYLFHGVLLDVQERQNLTDQAGSGARMQMLATIPAEEKIAFKPKGTPRFTVTVFTDISCHYCQELHKHLADYLARGIEIDYVPFPREGTQSPAYGQMIAVWCAKNRQEAYASAIAGQPVPALACANPVAKNFELGERLNIEGTPAIYSSNGMQLGGFLPPDQLLTSLQAEAARLHPVASAVSAAGGHP